RADRRARRGPRETRPHDLSVHRDGSRGPASDQARVRPRVAVQPRQGVPGAAPLRRARSRARARRCRALPVVASILMSHPSDSAVFPRTAAHALEPRDDADLADLLGSHTGPFELVGGGSKRALGRPPSGQPLVLRSLAGIIDYEPAELTLRAHAATPLGVVE